MGFWSRLFGAPEEPKLPEPTGRVWNMEEHRGWGDTIYFSNWDERKITGWLPFKLGEPRIRVGDEVRCKMKDGRTARFIVTELESMSDPRDMFFGKVADLDYVEEEADELGT